jgi:hypothetical protein
MPEPNGSRVLLGRPLAARAGTCGRAALVAVLTALAMASQQVSFTAVIDATPSLRAIDRVGRRP